MKPQKRHIIKALESLGYEHGDLNSIDDLKMYISQFKTDIEDLKNMETKVKEQREKVENLLFNLLDVEKQIEVEIYKELNPRHEVFFLN